MIDPPTEARGTLLGAIARAGTARFVVYDAGAEAQIVALDPGSDEVVA